MALSYVIEYLLSRTRGQGYLVNHSASQTIIPAVPPGFEVTLALLPAGNDYANIVYESGLFPNMVPDSFYSEAQYAGNQTVAGVLSSHWVQRMNSSFQVISRAMPAVLTIRNITNVNQFYGGVAYFISIKSEGAYQEVLEELSHLGNSRMEGLAKESNRLLNILVHGGAR